MFFKLCFVLTFIYSSVYGHYVPDKVWDRKLILTPAKIHKHDLVLGSGYNSITLSQTFNAPLKFKDITETHKEEFELMIKSAETDGEIFSALSDDLLNTGVFLNTIGQENMLGVFFKESHATNYTSALVAKVTLVTSVIEGKGLQMTSEAAKLLDRGNYEDYVNFYGTHQLTKAYLGGYLYLVIKFKCETLERKYSLDESLSRYDGRFGDLNSFTKVLQAIKESNLASDIHLFSVGNTYVPHDINVNGYIEMSRQFVHDVIKNPQVIKLEYRSGFFVQDSTFGFRDYVTPIQENIDKLSMISAEYFNAKAMIKTCLDHSKDMYISKYGVKEVHAIHDKTNQQHNDFLKAFRTAAPTEFNQVIQQNMKTPYELQHTIWKLLQREKMYESNMMVYLKCRGLDAFISIDDNSYPRLTKTSPIRINLKIENRNSPHPIYYNRDHVVITSDTKPEHYLCMGSNNWYVFWGNKRNIYLPKCTWKIHEARGAYSGKVEYGDAIIINNQYWPNYVIGVSDDKKWLLTAEKASALNHFKHQWLVSKTT